LVKKLIFGWLMHPVLGRLAHALARVGPLEIAADFVTTRIFSGIPFLEPPRWKASVEQVWDSRAKLNAMLVATGAADEEQALASGAWALENGVLRGLQPDSTWVVLEIGCGIGNLLRPLAPLVKEAHGVDISAEMLRKAEEWLRGIPNVGLHKTDGRLDMFPDGYFDFVFSCLVFIHFPSKPLVYEYFKETARVLKPGGIFRFNVDGRNYMRWRRHRGGTIRGVVFTTEEIRENLERHGFRVQDVTGAGSLDMWVTAVLDRAEPRGPSV